MIEPSSGQISLNPPKRNCHICNKDCTDNVTFYNNEPNYFMYLSHKKEAHIECYINLCIAKALEKIKEDK